MNPAALIKLHPAGPWRSGPGEGGRDGVDALYGSDRFFSAITIAFARLGMVEEWLAATARAAAPQVVLSSLFPFQGETLFAPPPATLWPPTAGALRTSSPVFSTKVRWRVARFVPLPLIETLLLNQRLLADQWLSDADSACLLRRDRPQASPYRTALRTQTAIDRLSRNGEPHSMACVEFESGSGLWAVVSFKDEMAAAEWKDKLRAAFRLLSDTGFGGRRSSGWGQVTRIDLSEGSWPDLLFPKLAKRERTAANGSGPASQWLLSLFTPGEGDEIDWSQGHYSVTTRGGFVDGSNGNGRVKKVIRMVQEGSVLTAANALRGAAIDVAPEGIEHPVYRAGFALSMTLPRVDYSAVVEEPAGGSELEEVLEAALRTAAEQDVAGIALETASAAVGQFEEAEKDLSVEAPAAESGESSQAEQPREETRDETAQEASEKPEGGNDYEI